MTAHRASNPLQARVRRDRHVGTVAERAGWPTTRTGHDFFDALHALALEEVRENPTRKLVGVTTAGPRIPRQGQELYQGDRPLGSVASHSTKMRSMPAGAKLINRRAGIP